MEIEQEIIGFNGEGEVILRYSMSNSAGMKVTLLNVGAAVESINLPGKGCVILTYPSYKDYVNDSLFMGKCVGRVAGRVAKSRFMIDEKSYKLSSNEGTTHLNGGVNSFASKLWQGRTEKDMVVFSYVSSAGEEGYPAEFGVEVGYTLSEDGTLGVTVMGEADGDTIVNIAPFIYFQLGERMELMIKADKYVPLNTKRLSTGGVASVEATPFDFRDFRSVDGEYDDYWMRDRTQTVDEICILRSAQSGVEVEIQSSQQALFFSNCSDIEGCGVDKNGEDLKDGCAVLLVPMAVSDESLNNLILRVGQKYQHHTTYKFKSI